jgi:ArsR family transcriptional regulator
MHGQQGESDVPMKQDQLLLCLKALAHPMRLAIFDMLMEGVQCNCEISEGLGLSLSLTSHHIRLLCEAGLVTAQRDARDGRWIYYSVDPQALAQLQGQLDQLLDARRIQPRLPSCGPGRCIASKRLPEGD